MRRSLTPSLLVCVIAVPFSAAHAGGDIDLVVEELRLGTPQVCRLAPGEEKARRIDLAPKSDPGAIAFGGSRPRWSPDGTKVAFQVKQDHGGTNLVLVNKDGTGWRQITTDGGAADPAWSPDGKRIAYRHGLTRETAIYVFDLESNESELLADLPEADRAPDWSPDGTKVVFSSGTFAKRRTEEDLYIVDVGTGEVRRIVDNLGRDTHPRFSPDGKFIAWTGAAREHDEQIYICTIDGMNARRVTAAGRNWDAAWSPDGTWIYHTTYQDGKFAINRTHVTKHVTEEVYAPPRRVEAPDVHEANPLATDR